MKIGDFIVVYVPTPGRGHPPRVLEAALPNHLTKARGVACEVVPELVPAGEDGDALVLRVEDIIPFRSVLAPVRPVRAPDAEPAAVGIGDVL